MVQVAQTDALIVVDVQRDFCAGGSLAVAKGDEVIEVINRLTPRFGPIIFTRDWHPESHCSFSDSPRYVDKSWPKHCVAGTHGAQFRPELRIPANGLIYNKGTRTDTEAYSGFEGTSLSDDLRALGVLRVFVCGLATDYCVRATALDGIRHGFEVILIEDACRAVDVPEGSAARAILDMREAGVTVCRSEDIG